MAPLNLIYVSNVPIIFLYFIKIFMRQEPTFYGFTITKGNVGMCTARAHFAPFWQS